MKDTFLATILVCHCCIAFTQQLVRKLFGILFHILISLASHAAFLGLSRIPHNVRREECVTSLRTSAWEAIISRY